MNIIGLHGKAGSGKDYIGRNVLHPLGYHKISLANHMKVTAIGQGHTWQDVMIDKPPVTRAALQHIGTELGWMKYGKNYWCDIASAWMQIAAEDFGITHFYVPDIRFVHEVEWVHALGGKVVKVEGMRKEMSPEAMAHASETALDGFTGFDAVIYNTQGVSVKSLERALCTAGIITPQEVSYGRCL